MTPTANTESAAPKAAGWLPTVAACRRLKMSPEMLMRRICRGQIEARLLNRRWRISAASLDAFLRDHAGEL